MQHFQSLIAILFLVIASLNGSLIRNEYNDSHVSISRIHFCPFSDLVYINVFQVYTSDLTSLFLWTCPRCKGHTKVCASYVCESCSTCSLEFNSLFFCIIDAGF
jgi:hypothetical protein